MYLFVGALNRPEVGAVLLLSLNWAQVPHILVPNMLLEAECSKWAVAVQHRLSEYVPNMPEFSRCLNVVLKRHNAKLAGGFVARCVLHYQLASSQFFKSEEQFWEYQSQRFFSEDVDLDVYVPHLKMVKFVEDLHQMFSNLEEGHVMSSFHLSPQLHYKSFMRMNGILGRVQMKFHGKKIDIMSCKRQVPDVIRNFDLSGVCMGWDGERLNVYSETPSMHLYSAHKYPQFKWCLNADYVSHWQTGSTCIHKRINKYGKLGVHVEVNVCAREVSAAHYQCEMCIKNPTYARWGQTKSQFCAKHRPFDSHCVLYWHESIILLKRLFVAVHNATCSVSWDKMKWQLQCCDPESFLQLPWQSALLNAFQQVYSHIAGTHQGFLAWLCLRNVMCAIPDAQKISKFFQDEGSGTWQIPEVMQDVSLEMVGPVYAHIAAMKKIKSLVHRTVPLELKIELGMQPGWSSILERVYWTKEHAYIFLPNQTMKCHRMDLIEMILNVALEHESGKVWQPEGWRERSLKGMHNSKQGQCEGSKALGIVYHHFFLNQMSQVQ